MCPYNGKTFELVPDPARIQKIVLYHDLVIVQVSGFYTKQYPLCPT